jgi:hypothetical protein
MLFDLLGGKDRFAEVDVQLLRYDRVDAPTNAEATAHLRVTVMDADPRLVGRAFSNAVIELSLASYSGFFPTTPPSSETAFGVYWPALVPASEVAHRVVLPDGSTVAVPPTGDTRPSSVIPDPMVPPYLERGEPAVRAALGTVCGARSGDKGGNANVGLWVRDPAAFAWLADVLTVDRFRELLAEAADLPIERYLLPNIGAVNFVVAGILGEGVASSVRLDPQAKGLGEYVRSRFVDVPVRLLPGGGA